MVFVGFFFYGTYVLLFPSRTAGDRLRELQKVQEPEVYDIITVDRGPEGVGGAVASKIGSLATPQSEEERNLQRLRLLQAGFKNRHALEIFNGIRVSLAI